MKKLQELRTERAGLIAEARQIVSTADEEKRALTAEEEKRYQKIMDDGGMADQLQERIDELSKLELVDRLKDDIERRHKLENAERFLERSEGLIAGMSVDGFPNIVKNRLSDEQRALAHYFRTGDTSRFDTSGSRMGVDVNLRSGGGVELQWDRDVEQRAVVDSTMNITTGGDGGDLVPTGFVQMIATRKNERMLSNLLGVRRVPGKGTTVDFPIENADPEPFASTSEQADDGSTNNYERDALQVDKVSFTLVKYTKKLELTEELLDDEDASLLEFIADSIGRSVADTHNNLLLTEVAANGTALKTFASASAIAAGEPESIIYNDTLGYYLNDASNIGWVMRPSTFGAISSITGDSRLYAETPAGSFSRVLLGYRAYYSNHATAIGASAKSVYFGDWNHVGFREAPAMRFLRDPFSKDGLVVLKYSFRTVYKVLQAGAIGYAQHPTA